MLQRLASVAHALQQQQQQQHLLLPLLQQFQQQHVLVQQSVQPASTTRPASTCTCSGSSASSLLGRPGSISSLLGSSCLPHGSTWFVQTASLSQRASKLNPKERKAQEKTSKRALKMSAVPQSTASASDSATSFEDEMQAVEADVTRLVLQVCCWVWPLQHHRLASCGLQSAHKR